MSENQSVQLGELHVRFTPAPEPSTYAAAGAALLLGIIGLRVRRHRSAADAPA